MQCMERRPAEWAENAQVMVLEEAMRRESEPESEPEPEWFNNEGP